MTVAYDGTNYSGWQLQPNHVTIEEILNKTLSDLLKEPVCIVGASRTDSGVHALGNVAVFDTETRMPGDKICYALNQRLPDDIRILDSCDVPLSWHPRKQNCTKTYEYKILNRRVEIPIGRSYAHFCYFPLDLEKMRAGAACLVGEHDFASFCSARHQAAETVRTVYSLTLDKDERGLITLRISGNGFLYNMVRIIAGTLLKVGMGVYPPEHVEEILEARDRQQAGQTAPARGLTLIGIEYEKEPQTEIRGSNRHWNYVLDQSRLLTEACSLLDIKYCEQEELERLIRRMAHQAYRNGAKRIFVRVPGECIVSEETRYGLYRLVRAGEPPWQAVPGTSLWEAVYAGDSLKEQEEEPCTE